MMLTISIFKWKDTALINLRCSFPSSVIILSLRSSESNYDYILILTTLFSLDSPTVWISVILPVIFCGQQSIFCHVIIAELLVFCYFTTSELSQSRIGNLVSDEPGIC